MTLKRKEHTGVRPLSKQDVSKIMSTDKPVQTPESGSKSSLDVKNQFENAQRVMEEVQERRSITSEPKYQGLDSIKKSRTAGVITKKLPCGLLFSGKRIRDVQIGRLLGYGRKIISDREYNENFGAFVTGLCSATIVSIGDFVNHQYLSALNQDRSGQDLTKQVIQLLPIPDRIFLCYNAVGLTNDWKMQVPVICPVCKRQSQFTLDIASFTYPSIDDYQDVIIDYESHYYIWRSCNDELGVDVTFRLGDGYVHEGLGLPMVEQQEQTRKRDLADIYLAKNTILTLNGIPGDEIPAKFWDGDTVDLINWIDNEISSHTPSAKTDMKMRCPYSDCASEGEEIAVGGDVERFLSSGQNARSGT